MASRLRTPRLIVGLTLSLAILLVAPTTHAQVVLRPKLKPNSKRVFHSEASTKQILTLAGMDVETSSNQFVVMEQVTQPRSDDGTLRLTDTNKKLQQEITLPGFKISFDSDNPNKKAPLPQFEPMLDLLRLIANPESLSFSTSPIGWSRSRESTNFSRISIPQFARASRASSAPRSFSKTGKADANGSPARQSKSAKNGNTRR